MQHFQTIIISIIILALVAGILFFLGQFLFNQLGNIQVSLQSEEAKTQEDTSKEQKTQPIKSIIKSAEPGPIIPTEPAMSINTYIISGPEQEEIIQDTNKITFEWNAEADTEERISFETKIEGIDEDWVSTSSNKRTITFPAGPKEYTFLVRAKTKDSVDTTPASRTFKINVSPYFGKIEIYSRQYQTTSQPSLITLISRLNEQERINITDWRIKGNKGELIIHQAIEKYQPLGTPGNIFVKQQDRVYLLGGQNPFENNKNFRVNKCFGYYSNYYTFRPSISKNCPKPTLEQVSHFNQYCQEFILRLSRCEIPNYSDNFMVATDSECVSYLLKNFNYSGCFKYHQNDEDFLKNYWYVYLNSDIVSKLHDTLELRDQNGLLVDKYIY